MKCQWCNKEIVAPDKEAPYYLECPDVHVLLTLSPTPSLKIEDTIIGYVVYFDKGNVRYRLWGNCSGTTSLYSKVGSRGYKIMLTTKYFPLKVEDDILQYEHLIEKFKKLVIFS